MKSVLAPKKYLICIPQDGLNDMLNRIWHCYQYALRFKRILVVDTRKSPGFKDDISNYLKFKSSIFYKGNLDTLYDALYGKSIYPSELSSVNLKPLTDKILWGSIRHTSSPSKKTASVMLVFSYTGLL